MPEDQEAFTLSAEEAASLRQGFKFCPRCRTEMVDREVYDRVRRVCPNESCRFVQFIDPKVSAAVLAVNSNNEVLLIERSMEPARGSWCLPGGFIEIGETPQQAAIRECKEETGLDVEITDLIDVFYYEDYRGSGILIMYKGQIQGGQARPGDDSEQVRFFEADGLPEKIAFDTNIEALTAWRKGKI